MSDEKEKIEGFEGSSLVEAGSSQIDSAADGVTPSGKQKKIKKIAVPNWSTPDFTFQGDNPFGDKFEMWDRVHTFDTQLTVVQGQSANSRFFKTSGVKQHPKIREFLQKKMTGNAFNKFCLDCKKKKTSHFVVYMGIFVCMDCATHHSRLRNFIQSEQYIKDVNVEQWDDWQLKSV